MTAKMTANGVKSLSPIAMENSSIGVDNVHFDAANSTGCKNKISPPIIDSMNFNEKNALFNSVFIIICSSLTSMAEFSSIGINSKGGIIIPIVYSVKAPDRAETIFMGFFFKYRTIF